MAAVVAVRAAEMSPRDIRLVGADVSPSGGRDHPWEALALEFARERPAG